MTRSVIQETSATENASESMDEPGALDAIEVAGGSVCGREHARLGRGSQDAMCWRRGERFLVAVVSDGCGSGRHSEVGAKLGSRLYTEALSRRLAHGASPASESMWQGAQIEVVERLRDLAVAMGGDLAAVVSDYFLFTIVGAVLTPELTAVFALGDGLYALNGEINRLGPFADNSPPYLSYELLAGRERKRELVQPIALVPTAVVDSVLLATDGACDLLESEEPGKGNAGEGRLRQFWSCDRYFSNADGVRRRLALLNREVVDIDWESQRIERSPGILADDTTLIALRRRSERGGRPSTADEEGAVL